jgi:YbbR domain-containing protein
MSEKIKINIKPIIGSLAVALILWIMVATEKIYSYQIRVPIEIVRLAQNKTLLEPIPENAVIEVQGKGRSLIAAWFYDVRFRLEFPTINKSQTINLSNYLSYLDLPATFALQVQEIIEPKSIDLKIDNSVERKVPVILSEEIKVENGYVCANHSFGPDSVVITGPASKVNQIDHIPSGVVEQHSTTSEFSHRITLPNPEPGILEISPQNVQIHIDIQLLVDRIVYKIPIMIRNVRNDLEVAAIPPELALKVKGGEKIVAALQASDIKAEIDYRNQYRRDREKYAASISTPENISWIECIPKTFSLQVKRKQ